MIKVNQIKMPVEHTETDLHHALKCILKIRDQEIKRWYIDKQSIDARKKPDIYYVYSVCVELYNEELYWKKNQSSKNHQVQSITPKTYEYKPQGQTHLDKAPIVVGSGPAGLFCAYHLAEQGYKPVLLERGGSVEERLEDVEHFWQTGQLNTESNVQFGEGGAGTFSDGKLNTGVKDPFGRNKRVLEIFVEHGAPKSILYDSKPHIGTDILIHVVRSMRNRILEWGGVIHFHSKVTGLEMEDNEIKGVYVNESQYFPSPIVVLAIGHSARDTFTYLYERQIPMEAKSFAIGVRVEHPQSIIDDAQYGKGHAEMLPAAPYKLTANLESGRGVYSFCMCPGGYVVNASSEERRLVVNGMSYSKRDSHNANSAIVVTVNPSDYAKTDLVCHPLQGMYYQRDLEEKAFYCGDGKIPVQTFGDFCAHTVSNALGSVNPVMKGAYTAANVRSILPDFMSASIEEGMHIFGKKIKGFDHMDSLISGIESRTSSPVRILRNDEYESRVSGLYPCGEGAGYAGGITSAAIDGIKVYEAIANRYSIPEVQKRT